MCTMSGFPFLFEALHFLMLVTPVLSVHWLLTRPGGPVKPAWLNTLCSLHFPYLSAKVMECHVWKLYFPCGHSSILQVICST